MASPLPKKYHLLLGINLKSTGYLPTRAAALGVFTVEVTKGFYGQAGGGRPISYTPSEPYILSYYNKFKHL